MRTSVAGLFLVLGIAIFVVSKTGSETAPSLPDIDLRKQVVRPLREPDYQTKPLYSLLVFGESGVTRHWLVVDGETLYVDFDGDGDLTDPEDGILFDPVASKALTIGGSGEYSSFRIFKITNLRGHDFKFNFWVANDNFTPPENENPKIAKWRHDRESNGWSNATLLRQPKFQSDSFGAQIPVTLCLDSSKTQVSYIDGPKTFVLKQPFDGEKLSFTEDNVFSVKIGSLGEPPINSNIEVASVLLVNEIPKDLHPIAEFSFVSKDDPKVVIQRSIKLDRRC